MTTTAVVPTPTERMATLKDALDKARPSLAMVLPKHLTPERLIKIALVAASRNPVLLQCSQTSILQAVMQAAELGLEPSGVLGSAYLVPFRNRKTGQYEATLIPGYRGLIELALRSESVLRIEARVVRDGDTFELCYGTEPSLIHKPDFLESDGGMIGVYAVAYLKEGPPQVEYMTKGQVDAIRVRSRSANEGPWVSDYEEMARKTVVRRLCKYLPASAGLNRALEAESEAEAGLPPTAVEEVEPQSKTQELVTRLSEQTQNQGVSDEENK